MQAAAETIAELLNAQPDPVRTQIISESIQVLTNSGQPALEYQREKLALAAQAVSDWAVGAMARETARQVLDAAIQTLSPQPTPGPTPTPTLDSARIPAIQIFVATGYEALNAW